jgi:hypothetical protein
LLWSGDRGLRHIRRPPFETTRSSATAVRSGATRRPSSSPRCSAPASAASSRRESPARREGEPNDRQSRVSSEQGPKVGGLQMEVRSAPLSLMSASQRPRGGPREHVICEGSRAHPIFAALACARCVEEARMAIFVDRGRFHMLFARVCCPPRILPGVGASGASTWG